LKFKVSFKQAALDPIFSKKSTLAMYLASNFLTESFIDFEDANFSFGKIELFNNIIQTDTLINTLFS
jgi:hypothetical protein